MMNSSSAFKTVRTSELEVAYFDFGPRDGTPVILVHGWPDDATTWLKILPHLHDAGFRTYLPFVRGFGPTKFLGAVPSAPGHLEFLASDLLEFASVLGLSQFHVIGHDWGARAAYIAACLAPERIASCTAISVGWGTNSPDQELSLIQTRNYWYHWLFATERGRHLLAMQGKEMALFLWKSWSPAWDFPPEEFESVSPSFDNPAWLDVTIHSYRVRWGFTAGDPRCAEFVDSIARNPIIRVPTLVLHGLDDQCNDPATSAGRESLFSSLYVRELVAGAGHFPQRERPAQVGALVSHFLSNLRASGVSEVIGCS